jgi:subtilase family serine protease
LLKFKITPERFAEAANIIEFLTLTGSNTSKDLAYRMLPRFLLDENGEYMVTVKLDEDGDIQELEKYNEALFTMIAVNPKRLEKLALELVEAAKTIVNPPNTRD